MDTKELKLSYEQLEALAGQATDQNQKLSQRVKELENFSLFKRLDYLFLIVKMSDKFDSELVKSVVNEITYNIVGPKEDTTDKVETTSDPIIKDDTSIPTNNPHIPDNLQVNAVVNSSLTTTEDAVVSEPLTTNASTDNTIVSAS